MISNYAAFGLSKVNGTTCNGYAIDKCKVSIYGSVVLAHKDKSYAVIIMLCTMHGTSLYVTGDKNKVNAYYNHVERCLD